MDVLQAEEDSLLALIDSSSPSRLRVFESTTVLCSDGAAAAAASARPELTVFLVKIINY